MAALFLLGFSFPTVRRGIELAALALMKDGGGLFAFLHLISRAEEGLSLVWLQKRILARPVEVICRLFLFGGRPLPSF